MRAPAGHHYNSGENNQPPRGPSSGTSHLEIKSSMKPVLLNPSGSCISAFAQNTLLHRPTEVLQILINLHRNMLMDIQRPTWWTKQGRLSEISLLNAFGDKGRDPSYGSDHNVADHNIENYCYSPMKIMYH